MESAGSELITYYLEMTSPDQLRPARLPAGTLYRPQGAARLSRSESLLLCRGGRAYSWMERLRWTDEHWLAWLERPNVQTWIGYVRETPAGYFELQKQSDMRNRHVDGSSASGDAVELVYFGLLPPFVGQGWGALC